MRPRRFWIIPPYANDPEYEDRFEEYWRHDTENSKQHCISIGWDIDDPKGKSVQEIAAMLSASGTFGNNVPHIIFKFMNEIAEGDRVVARKGVSEVIGIGTVTREGFYDSEFCQNLEAAKEDHHKMFLGVRWDPGFQRRKVRERILSHGTLVELTAESKVAKAEPWLLRAVGLIGDNDQLVREVIEIAKRDDLTETERTALILARIGQPGFRDDLIQRWENKCALTGLRNSEMLVASHIKPWKNSTNSERLDVDNGLLLHAGIDRAFDRGLISFADDGQILISNGLSVEDCVILGISKNSRIAPINPAVIRYLTFHRENVYRGQKADAF
jgi:hypothetical protein